MVKQQSLNSARWQIVNALLILLIATFTLHGRDVRADSIEKQRLLFQDASLALNRNQISKFKDLVKQLGDYPAKPYLYYYALKRVIHRASADEVRQFIKRYEDYAFNYHIRSAWLNELAKRKDWSNYLLFFENRDSPRYQCLAFQARLALGLTEDINDEIRKVWLQGYSQPDECDDPFAHLLKTYPQSEKLVWLRIEKAFAARRPNLARYLSRQLNEQDKVIVDRWYQGHRRPEKSLEEFNQLADNEINRKIIVHALDRLARRDGLKARDLWITLKTKFAFEKDDIARLKLRIALSAAHQHKAEARELLLNLPDELKNDQAHLWLARIQLRNQEWRGLQDTITKMPSHLSSENEWKYWLARSMTVNGEGIDSAEILQSLAAKTSYYGFLAADRLQQGYRIEQENAAALSKADATALLEENAHLLLARELFFVDRLVDAKREWFQALRQLNPQQIKQAATLASGWKWHDSAIRTVARTPHRSDYSLRFPMPYKKQVLHYASLKKLDPSVVYGVMRRESLFDPLAKSRVGALGLMQLMPATARSVAKSLGLKRPRQSDILKVDNNIKFGTQYFRSVMTRFDNNVSLAAAAYNAGPGNVKRWLPQKEALSADLWVETVPFKETRNYVKAVLAYSTVFDKSLGQQVLMSSRMGDVQTKY